MKDLAGDDNHWAATVTSSAFKGKTRVQQHQMVYAALKGNMGGVLHALQLTTMRRTEPHRHGPPEPAIQNARYRQKMDGRAARLRA